MRIYWLHKALTCFAVWTGKPWRAIADPGHVVTRWVMKALTDMRAVESVMPWRTSVFTERSYPARQAATLPGHQVTVGVVDTLAAMVAVGTELAFVTFCRHTTVTASVKLYADCRDFLSVHCTAQHCTDIRDAQLPLRNSSVRFWRASTNSAPSTDVIYQLIGIKLKTLLVLNKIWEF